MNLRLPFWRNYVFLIVLFFSPTPGFSQGSLHHTVVDRAESGHELALEATPMSAAQVVEGKLFYRVAGEQAFAEQFFEKYGFNYRTILSADKLTAGGLEYVVVFRFNDGSMATYPNHDPFINPQLVEIHQSDNSPRVTDQSILSNILILSPDPEEILRGDEVVIAASYFNTSNVDLESITLSFNGLNVTEQAYVGEGLLSYDPGKLDNGMHQITINMDDLEGQKFTPLSWNFMVGSALSKSSDYFSYGGSIGSRLSTEKVGGIPLEIGELSGQIEGDFKWAKVRNQFKITTRESPYKQPQNKLGTNFIFGRILKLDIGDFNPHFTPFTIDGKRVRGFNLDLDFNWLRFQYLKGELNRTVQHSGQLNSAYSFIPEETITDSTGINSYFMDRKGYNFERNILALRFSIDIKSKFIMGLHLLQVRDNKNSIQMILPNSSFTVDSTFAGITAGEYSYNEFLNLVENSGQGDSLKFLESKIWSGGAPKDNLVLGFNIGRKFDQKKLSLDFNWNLSLFNRNIWDGAMSRAEMDLALDDQADGKIGGQAQGGGSSIDTSDIIFDPLKIEKFFTINTYMSPLVPIDITTIQKKPFSTIINMPSAAYNLKLRGNYAKNSFMVEFRQVGPEYISLGNPFLRNNIREFSIKNRMSFLDYRLMITGGFKHQDNQILETVVDPLSTNTFSMNLNFMPGPGMPSFMFNYQSIGKNNKKTELDTVGSDLVDLREDSKAANNLIAITLPIHSGRIKHNLVINYSGIINKDNLDFKRSSGYLFPKTDTKTFTLNLSSIFQSPLRTGLSFNSTKLLIPFKQRNLEIIKIPYTWVSGVVNGQYSYFQNKLKIMGTLSFLDSKGSLHTQILGFRSGADYKFSNSLAANINFTFLLNIYPDFTSDGIDNDKNDKIDDSGEKYEVNVTGMLFTVNYKF